MRGPSSLTLSRRQTPRTYFHLHLASCPRFLPRGGCRGRSSNIFHDLAPTTRSFPPTSTTSPVSAFSTSSTGDPHTCSLHHL
ncbi:hypothetical protein Hamer_G030103 [Homarus americanus]|uniref:Uncharacterized protein n=1 Tax=Homarus americanus TaxID=6706 RepID=A0A8J5MLF8_HOMAM|nr:hypothetical protein Hamer_G030103 [Homarus americanus]